MDVNKDFWIDSSFKVKSSGKDDNGSIIISGYASTVSKDRAGDVVLASAWEKDSALGNYIKNPIVLFAHNHSEPIGKMVGYTLDDYGLLVDIEVFDVDSRVYKLVKGGALTTFSIGFRLKDYKYDEGSETFLITELELFEISIVSVPCNQDCTFELAKSMRDDGSYEELRAEAIKNLNGSGTTEKPNTNKPTFNSEIEKLAYLLGKK